MNNENQSRTPLKIILWSLALEPLILAAMSYFIRHAISSFENINIGNINILLTIFLSISVVLIAIGLQFASGRFAPPDTKNISLKRCLPPGHHIAAMAFFSSPGIFGFILHLLSGNLWVLAIFNVSAFLIASHHIISRLEAER